MKNILCLIATTMHLYTNTGNKVQHSFLLHTHKLKNSAYSHKLILMIDS